jgi:hypothetical protein
MRTRLVVIAVALLSALLAHSAAPPGRSFASAKPAPDWEAKFAGKKGWIGGDGVYSVALGPKRVLWLFGDTLLGEVKDGRRGGAKIVNNTIAIQDGTGKDATIRFLSGKPKEDKPTAFFVPSDGKGWFWPQAAVVSGDRLFIFLAQIDKSGAKGVFGFKHIGQWLAVIENPNDKPEKWKLKQHKLPFADFTPGHELSWGAAALAEGEHVYVYGYAERGKGLGRRRLTVARAPAGKLADFESWRFRTSEGWSKKSADAVSLADGLATEFSVSKTPGGKGYVVVYTEIGLGDRIVARFADEPQGPWSDSVLLYRCPEMKKDKGVFSYAAKAHPWASGDGQLLVSYCVNTWDFWRLFRDESVYRPKFVRVKLKG